jgi:hypothetical protein
MTLSEVEVFDGHFWDDGDDIPPGSVVAFDHFDTGLGTLVGVILGIDASFFGIGSGGGPAMITIADTPVYLGPSGADEVSHKIDAVVDLLDPAFPFGTSFFTGTSTFDAVARIGFNSLQDAVFRGDLTLTYRFEPVPAIPSPAGLPLLLTGVLALAAAGCKRHRG